MSDADNALHSLGNIESHLSVLVDLAHDQERTLGYLIDHRLEATRVLQREIQLASTQWWNSLCLTVTAVAAVSTAIHLW